jgi:hypothetical protein
LAPGVQREGAIERSHCAAESLLKLQGKTPELIALNAYGALLQAFSCHEIGGTGGSAAASSRVACIKKNLKFVILS